MQVTKTVEETRKQIKAWKKEGKTVGLVPTMGFLHEGHASLIKKCREENDIVVVSDFVNPTQFGPTEDLEAYVNGSEIMSSVKDAWNEFKNVPNAYQRDYIYYGITKENKPGTLNRYIREKLYRFRIAANAYSAINDPTQDPTLQDTHKEVHPRLLS